MKLTRSRERVSKHGEVFTPSHIVRAQHKLIPNNGECSWSDPTMVYLEPTCGNGQFVVAAVQRKLSAGLSVYDAVNTVFGMDIMADNILECQTRVLDVIIRHNKHKGIAVGTRESKAITSKVVMLLAHNICKVKDSLKEMSSGRWVKYPFLEVDPTGTSTVAAKGGPHCLRAGIKAKKIKANWEAAHGV